MKTTTTTSKYRKSAKTKVMDILARRPHSEKEIRQKMRLFYRAAEIEEAIQFACENGWMTEPQEMSKRMTEELHRKKKGIRYINNYLQQKGLPSVEVDRDIEFEKARELIRTKLAKSAPYNIEEKMKIQRWLTYRGYEEETIRKVMHEK